MAAAGNAQQYVCRSTLPVPAAEAFRWHERPGALQRLLPPWESVRVLREGSGIEDGQQVELASRVGPFWLKWLCQHEDYQPPERFVDVQRRRPFASWRHCHEFKEQGDDRCLLEDRIDFRLPGGRLAKAIAGTAIRKRIDRMFQYRHTTTRDDLQDHARYREQPRMRIGVTGSSGLIGSALVSLLATGGHQPVRVVRGKPVSAGAKGRDDDANTENAVGWDPERGHFDANALDGVDAVVHLAGENIAARRWTSGQKARIRDSRVEGTRLLCQRLATMRRPPQILVCASATGFYGDRGAETMTEESESGEGFLPEVCRNWESACQPAVDSGIRVVQLRFGIVLSPRGGALAKMLTPFQIGVGGKVGSGNQYWSWISLDDAIGAVHHALMNEDLQGPVNAVSPQPVTNLEFTRVLGRVLRRPTLFPMPAFAARLALGEMADALLLASTRVEPTRLLETGYSFRQPDLESALRHQLGRTLVNGCQQ